MKKKDAKAAVEALMKEKDEKPEDETGDFVKVSRLSPPDRVKIGYRWFDVEMVHEPSHFVKNPATGCMYGFCDFFKKRIYINDDCDAAEEANTLLHEILHVIHENYGFGMADAANWTGENFTVSVANGLCSVFQDNPYFVMYLMVNLGVEGFEEIAIDDEEE